jgi:hypothetical protein
VGLAYNLAVFGLIKATTGSVTQKKLMQKVCEYVPLQLDWLSDLCGAVARYVNPIVGIPKKTHFIAVL